ncbi:hypothetical protein I9W95_04870 [Thalassolituus marinus]|uniref:Uncharacterized protein n=1 Tax=Thalassolituus marinus TaxID=671053 RepID=A0ABS7ZML1_9GAMM|nr:hypothetical protein [Thalassolituus marinus]
MNARVNHIYRVIFNHTLFRNDE